MEDLNNLFFKQSNMPKGTFEGYYNIHNKKYGNGILYDDLIAYFSFYLSNSARFEQDRDALINWQAFLQVIKEIEKSIPTYAEYDGKQDNHAKWLYRVLNNFVKPYLEEIEIKNSDYGRDLQLEFYKPALTKHDMFHPGPGIPNTPDFVSLKTNELYDAKHAHVDTSKAHAARYILNYQNNGFVLEHDLTKNPTYTGVYIECREVADLAIINGLNSDLFFELDELYYEIMLGALDPDVITRELFERFGLK